MSNRNEDRLGLGLPIPSKDSSEPTEVLEEVGMGLDFPAPTEYVNLPSEGKYYPEGHLLKGQESVEINFMTTKDEDILSSKLLLKKGKAVEKFVDHILTDKRLKSKDLLICDKNAILIAARISGYGNLYEAGVICQSCGEKFKHTFDLNEITHKEKKEIEDVIEGENTFLVTLPKTKWIVEIRPLFGKDEEKLFKSMELTRKGKKEDSLLSDQMKLMIVSVTAQGKKFEDEVNLDKAVKNMPAIDAKYLREAYGKLFPALETTQEILCPECGIEQEVDMPIDVGFFWSK
jgi:hypothetical protein